MALPIRRGQEDVSRRDPLAEINRLSEQLRDCLGRWSSFPSLLGEGFTPLADVEETDEVYTVEVELPGVKGDEISVLTMRVPKAEAERPKRIPVK